MARPDGIGRSGSRPSATGRQWKPIGWAEEQGQIKAGVGPFLDRRQRERSAFVARRPFPTRGDKAVRAQSIRGRMALDGLHYLASAPWRAEFEAELMSFPAGKHDDQVDALGLVGQLLDIMVPGRSRSRRSRPATVGISRSSGRIPRRLRAVARGLTAAAVIVVPLTKRRA